jgi:hypothetical protein
MDENEQIEILKSTLAEQQRFHDELTNSFDDTKNRIVVYIGAILAILTFLCSGAIDTSKGVRERLFIPEELYGIIFYFFGLTCILYALFVLVRAMKMDTQWEVYTDTSDRRIIGSIDNRLTKREYLQEMVNGYEDASEKNLKSHKIKYLAVQNAFLPMIAGAIILVVLRFFQ